MTKYCSVYDKSCMLMVAVDCVVSLMTFVFWMLQFLVMGPVMLAQLLAYLEALDLRELGRVSQRKRCRPLQLLIRQWRRCCQNQVSKSIVFSVVMHLVCHSFVSYEHLQWEEFCCRLSSGQWETLDEHLAFIRLSSVKFNLFYSAVQYTVMIDNTISVWCLYWQINAFLKRICRCGFSCELIKLENLTLAADKRLLLKCVARFTAFILFCHLPRITLWTIVPFDLPCYSYDWSRKSFALRCMYEFNYVFVICCLFSTVFPLCW